MTHPELGDNSGGMPGELLSTVDDTGPNESTQAMAISERSFIQSLPSKTSIDSHLE
jgi:hypothetical protein